MQIAAREVGQGHSTYVPDSPGIKIIIPTVLPTSKSRYTLMLEQLFLSFCYYRTFLGANDAPRDLL
jgi:hypothetical protein